MGSILGEIKSALGLDPAAEGFDPELVLHINSVLSDFNQLGVGPGTGYAITGMVETWEDFLGDDPRYNIARSLAFIKVKMLFAPPQVGYVLTANEKLIEKMEWRLNIHREEMGSLLTSGFTKITGNAGDEHVIRLSNPAGTTLINAGGQYEAEFIAKATGASRTVALDLSELSSNVLRLPIVVETGTYKVRLLNPRRTIVTVEVTAQ